MKKKIAYIAIFFLTIICGACKSNDIKIDEGKGNSIETQTETIMLTYGYIDSKSYEDLNSKVQERIVTFNKSQSQYFIEIVKYGQDNYEDGLKALNTDIAAGKAPDIIEVEDETILRQWGLKGTIEDLYPYMDKGDGVKREEFIENVLPWFETEGKLYGITPLFKINSLIGNPNYIQSDRLTFSQLKELYNEYKEDSDIVVFNGLFQEQILWHCINTSIETFVDMETYTCNFINSEFQELLQFSRQFDENKNNGVYDFENYSKLQEGKLILFYQGVIGGLNNYVQYREISGKSGLLLGFPSVEGCSPRISTNFPFLTINSKSKYKDVAWKFIDTFFDEEFLKKQERMGMNDGFPLIQKSFDSIAEMKIEATKYIQGELSHGFADGTEIIYQALPTTQEDVDYIRKIINNSIPPMHNYTEIEKIISEEIITYWSGTKTVEQVMEIIQSRAQLYLDEIK